MIVENGSIMRFQPRCHLLAMVASSAFRPVVRATRRVRIYVLPNHVRQPQTVVEGHGRGQQSGEAAPG
jgi:hypothetical protein